jgi:hypothetical protein
MRAEHPKGFGCRGRAEHDDAFGAIFGVAYSDTFPARSEGHIANRQRQRRARAHTRLTQQDQDVAIGWRRRGDGAFSGMDRPWLVCNNVRQAISSVLVSAVVCHLGG